jgi:hypothetical protein
MLETIKHILVGTGGSTNSLSTIENLAKQAGIRIDQTHIVKTDNAHVARLIVNSEPPYKEHFLNGVILNRQGQVICCPPRKLITVGVEEFIKHLDTHELIEAANATMVSIYYVSNEVDEGEWKISTTRSMDADNFIPMGFMRLRDVFDELLGRYKLIGADGKYPFNPLHSYTFMISHPHYHVLPLHELHFVSCWDVAQQCYCDPDIDLDGLRQYRVTSPPEMELGDFIRQMNLNSMSNVAKKQFRQSMGFILRAKKGGKDYYLPSDITNFLRKYIYSSFRESIVLIEHRQYYVALKLTLIKLEDASIYNVVIAGSTLDAYVGVIEKILVAARVLYESYWSSGCLRIPGYNVNEFYNMAASLYSAKVSPDNMLGMDNIALLWPFVHMYIISAGA